MWPVTGPYWCPGVTYSLSLVTSVSGDIATDLSYFTIRQPVGKVIVTANPTLATWTGNY
jgi:hypothetical protein